MSDIHPDLLWRHVVSGYMREALSWIERCNVIRFSTSCAHIWSWANTDAGREVEVDRLFTGALACWSRFFRELWLDAEPWNDFEAGAGDFATSINMSVTSHHFGQVRGNTWERLALRRSELPEMAVLGSSEHSRPSASRRNRPSTRPSFRL